MCVASLYVEKICVEVIVNANKTDRGVIQRRICEHAIDNVVTLIVGCVFQFTRLIHISRAGIICFAVLNVFPVSVEVVVLLLGA